MTDAKMDALLDKFVARMEPKVAELAAAAAEKQIAPLLENHQRLQDQLKDKGRATADTSVLEKQVAELTKQISGKRTAPDHLHITQSEMSDIATYQRAKAAAAKLGVELVTVDDSVDEGETPYVPWFAHAVTD
ncbi:MAG: hypothetical protein AAFY80_07005 [Pseudomonadota bacterium]